MSQTQTPTLTAASPALPTTHLPDRDVFELPAERPIAVSSSTPAGLAISHALPEADTGRPTTHNGSSLQMAEENLLRLRRERERGTQMRKEGL